jgi:hypothetical protein
MSALGQKQTCAPQQAMSALPPIATVKANFPHKVMSADMCGARAYVCFGPIADIIRPYSIDQFISAAEQRIRHRKAERPCSLEVDH